MITVFSAGVTPTQLKKVKLVTPPAAGSRWRGIRHTELATTIKDEVLTRGWHIEKELYALSAKGADMAGALLLNKVRGVPDMPGMTLALGFLNSNTRRKALQLTVGASVTCCTNGMCTGNILLNRYHDHNLDLAEDVGTAIDTYVDAAAHIPAAVGKMREREITDADASEVLMEAGRQRMIGWAAIGRVDREYRNPTFAEHGTGTAWALLNAFTYTARNSITPVRQMETFAAFRAILPGGGDLN